MTPDGPLRRRILFLGFSVTGDPAGYASAIAAQWAGSEPGWQVSIIGLGGFLPIDLAHMIEGLLADHPCDLLVLDINTSIWRMRSRDPFAFDWPVRFMLEAAARAGCGVALVNLPRRDVDAFDDAATRAIAAVADGMGVPHLDLAAEVAASGRIGELLRDEVHATPAGTAWFAARLAPALAAMLRDPPRPRPPWQVLPPGSLLFAPLRPAGGTATESFQRTGLSLPVVTVAQDRPMALETPEDCIAWSIIAVMAPDSGWLRLEADGTTPVRLLVHDRHSYYRRFAVMPLPAAGRMPRLTATVEPGLPQVRLVKGEPNHGPRRVQVAGMLATRVPLDDLLAEARKATGQG